MPDAGIVDEERNVGLCFSCLHSRRITASGGAVYWLCGRAESDPRFVKYPRLPVTVCPGHENRRTGSDSQ